MKRRPQRDPVAAYKRKAVAARRIGRNQQCECGETRPEALITNTNVITCAACKRILKGQSTIDDHHVFGQANDPTTTIPVPVNDHRAELSVAQQDWPKPTLRNKDGSPLLAGAARIRGFVDVVVYLIPRSLLCDAEMLEELDAFLMKELGAEWWRGTPLDHFEPKG